MAIQVNGTQVIGNSRELTNIASIDATTAAAIGAAGVGGGGELDFTSSGNIAAGTLVGVRSDGKIGLNIAGENTAYSSAFNTDTPTSNPGRMIKLTSGKAAILLRQSGYWYMAIGTSGSAGNNWTFGSFVSMNRATAYADICYDPDNDKIAFVAADGATIYGKMVSYSGTTIGTLHSEVTVAQNNYGCNWPSLTYDTNRNRFFGVFSEMYYASAAGFTFTANSSGTIQNVGWNSSTSSGQVFNTSVAAYNAAIFFHSGENAPIIFASRDNVNAFFKVGLSGNTPTKLAESLDNDGDIKETRGGITYDATLGKMILVQGYDGNAKASVVDLTGNTFTRGAKVQLSATPVQSVAVVSDNGSVRAFYIPAGQDTYNYAGLTATSSNTITVTDAAKIYQSSAVPAVTGNTNLVLQFPRYDIGFLDGARAFFLAQNTSSWKILSLNVVPTAELTSYVGILQTAATTNNTAPVTIVGGVNTAVSGLTTGKMYAANGGGLLVTSNSSASIGVALSSTSLLLT